MINVRKGRAHSLQQTDKVGLVVSGQAIVAGMVVGYDQTANSNTGGIVKAASGTAASIKNVGFALNNQADGDVVSSGKIGMYMLDGGSVIETDQVDNLATVAAAPQTYVGYFAIVSTNAGQVLLSSTSTGTVLGKVIDIRSLPTVTVPAVDGTTANWETTYVVAIKLGA